MEDHYRINVAEKIESRSKFPQYKHLFYAVCKDFRKETAVAIAEDLQKLYPTAAISITKWESRGHEIPFEKEA
jgi:hypothetical protein